VTPDWGFPCRWSPDGYFYCEMCLSGDIPFQNVGNGAFCRVPRELKAWHNKISREERASGKGRGFFVVHKHTTAQDFLVTAHAAKVRGGSGGLALVQRHAVVRQGRVGYWTDMGNRNGDGDRERWVTDWRNPKLGQS
jgi:hypothetical protein